MLDMIKSQPMAAIADNYHAAVIEMSRAFELMNSAQTRMQPFFGNDSFRVIDEDIRSFYISEPKRLINDSVNTMKKTVWREIANKMQVHSFMTEKRKNEFYVSLNSGDLPDITVENMQDFYNSFAGNIKSLMQETITEVFEMLRPHNSKHKTNTEYEIGKRVILSQYGGMAYIDSHMDTELTCIDNVFHLLDGKGVAKHPDTLRCKLNERIHDTINNELSTVYFRVKWYKKSGTIHLEFLRLDLLAKLNAAGGGNRLKG